MSNPIYDVLPLIKDCVETQIRRKCSIEKEEHIGYKAGPGGWITISSRGKELLSMRSLMTNTGTTIKLEWEFKTPEQN